MNWPVFRGGIGVWTRRLAICLISARLIGCLSLPKEVFGRHVP